MPYRNDTIPIVFFNEMKKFLFIPVKRILINRLCSRNVFHCWRRIRLTSFKRKKRTGNGLKFIRGDFKISISNFMYIKIGRSINGQNYRKPSLNEFISTIFT